MKTKVIVNPKSARLRTAKAWPEIETTLKKYLGAVDSSMTQRQGHATELARHALLSGCERIIAVGGDGTCNEVANGFFNQDKIINPEAVFSFVMSGTAGDFRKCFEVPRDLDLAVRSLAGAKQHLIDIGKASFTTFDGNSVTRYFLNFAGFGMVGCNDHLLNHSRFYKALGGGVLTYMGSAIHSMLAYKNQPIKLAVDGHTNMDLKVFMVLVFNGRFGGDMKWAPTAELDDGFLDLTVIGDFSKMRCLMTVPKCYSGEYIHEDGIIYQKVARIQAASDQDVLMSIDGESIGKLPATFEVVPKALNICC